MLQKIVRLQREVQQASISVQYLLLTWKFNNLKYFVGSGLRALETNESKMHRQYTSSSAGEEEFSAEELEEFATAFKVSDILLTQISE